MRIRKKSLLVLCAVLCTIALLPVIVMVACSFVAPNIMQGVLKNIDSYQANSQYDNIPRIILSIDQYSQIVEDIDYRLLFINNSFVYTVAILIGQIVITPSMAYGLARFRFAWKTSIVFLLTVLLLLPFQVKMVPTVFALRKVGLLDTVWAIILPAWVSPLHIILLRQHMISIPDEVFEAAQIDGAGPIRCFFAIALPLSKTMCAALFILSVTECWNMVEEPVVYLSKRTDLFPFSAIYDQFSSKITGLEFALGVIYMMLPVVIFLALQKQLLATFEYSALK